MSSKNDINGLVKLLVNALANEVSELFISTIEEHLENKVLNASKNQKLLIDSDELAELLSVSKSTIIKLRKQGLPTIKIGDAVRFEPEVAMQFLKLNFKEKEDERFKESYS